MMAIERSYIQITGPAGRMLVGVPTDEPEDFGEARSFIGTSSKESVAPPPWSKGNLSETHGQPALPIAPLDGTTHSFAATTMDRTETKRTDDE